MFVRKNVVGMVAVALAISACTSKKDKPSNPGFSKVVINSTGILNDTSLSSDDKAEKLALAAEQLMTAQSFMYADEVATSALTVDANNKRAQLIKALTGPAMVTKGILERVKPIAYRNAKSRRDYDKYLAEFQKQPNSALKTFAFNGKQDIKTERDAQVVIGQIQAAFDRLRIWFRDNKNVEMTLHVPAEMSQQAIDEQGRKCVANQISTGVYEVECDFTHALELNINQADIEAAQHIAAGYEMYISLYNSYDASGAIAVGDKFANAQNPQNKAIINELLKTKEFGVLRDGAGLKNILNMGLDALAGVRWAQKIQDDLCPKGKSDEFSRPDYVFSSGLCVDQDSKPLEDSQDPKYRTFGDVMRAVEVALRGGVISATFNGTLGSIDTDIKPSAVLANPVADLRSVAPTRYDRCGSIIGSQDNTLGGVFVRGDVNAVLLLNKDNCFPSYR